MSATSRYREPSTRPIHWSLSVNATRSRVPAILSIADASDTRTRSRLGHDVTVEDDAPVHWTLRRGMATIVTLAVVAVAGLLIWFATTTGGAPRPDVFPTGLRLVQPGEDARSPRQSSIGVSLAPGWAPTLFVNGTAIPDPQLDAGTRELGEFFFSPEPGHVVEDIRPGLNCARVIARPTIDGEIANFEFSWCWTAF